MNILILHSAQSIIIRKIINKYYLNDNVYVLTFNRNKGVFNEIATEEFFDVECQHIVSFDHIKNIQKVIDSKAIDILIGVYGNVNGNGYENLRVIFSNSICHNKIMFNEKLEIVDYSEKQYDSLIEFFNKNEHEVLPYISKRLVKYRQHNKISIEKVKKIMFIFDCCSINGTTNLIYYWANELNKRFNVSCVFENNGKLYNKFKEGNIKTYICDESNYDETATREFYFLLNPILVNEKPDLVVIAGNNTIVPCTIAAVKNDIPLIYKMNNGDFLETMDNRPTSFELKEMSSLYDSIIAVSNSVKNNIQSIGINSIINVIYGSNIDVNAINKKEISCCDELKNNKLNITCVSRLSPEKGVDVYLRAISQLNREILNKCSFIIVGDGTERDKLVNMAKELGIFDYVNFLGYRNDVFSIIKSSYLAVQPSRREGLVLTVLEAMSLSKMCIASDVGGTSEMIEHGNNGFLFRSEDYKELARLIEYCVNNAELVKRLEVNAFNTMKNKFDIKVVINKFCELFDSTEKA